jgi:hypothetical protein
VQVFQESCLSSRLKRSNSFGVMRGPAVLRRRVCNSPCPTGDHCAI